MFLFPLSKSCLQSMKLKNEMTWSFKYFCREPGGKSLLNRGPIPPKMPVGVGRPCGPTLPVSSKISKVFHNFIFLFYAGNFSHVDQCCPTDSDVNQ